MCENGPLVIYRIYDYNFAIYVFSVSWDSTYGRHRHISFCLSVCFSLSLRASVSICLCLLFFLLSSVFSLIPPSPLPSLSLSLSLSLSFSLSLTQNLSHTNSVSHKLSLSPTILLSQHLDLEHDGCKTIYVPMIHVTQIVVNPAWLLLMAWCPLGTKPSATIMFDVCRSTWGVLNVMVVASSGGGESSAFDTNLTIHAKPLWSPSFSNHQCLWWTSAGPT